jgi:hypothetical protein
MSEISVLSNQYKRLVDTSDKINNSVITFKKRDLLKHKNRKEIYPQVTISETDFASAKNNLLKFLTQLINLLNEENQHSEDLPLVIIEDYRKKLSEDAYFWDNLKDVIKALSEDIPLEEKDIRVLDRIVAVLDSERTTLFRKLRTARG